MAAFRNGCQSKSLVIMEDYTLELKKAMEWLAAQEKSIFLGQAVGCSGTAVFTTLADIDPAKRVELPVFESSQMGMSIGMAIQGYIPISIFPRYNFLLLAIDPLINFLDKIKEMSDGQYNPKVIIRTVVGSEEPLFPGHQHIGNFSEGIRKMVKTLNVVDLTDTTQIMYEYQKAYNREDDVSTLLVEFGDLLK